MQTANHISVIVPVLNERINLPKLIDQFRHFSFHQVVFVDGGSDDDSLSYLQTATLELSSMNVIESSAGRANQMNAGAKVATGNYLLFVHADTKLANDTEKIIQQSLSRQLWGRFDIEFIEPNACLSIIAWFINKRSRLTGVATGDQALFMRQDIFEQLGGYAEIPLMEDIEICKRLLKIGRPLCSKTKLKTSGRRWLKNGVIKTVLQMWRLRLAYFMGADPKNLAKQYRQVR